MSRKWREKMHQRQFFMYLNNKKMWFLVKDLTKFHDVLLFSMSYGIHFQILWLFHVSITSYNHSSKDTLTCFSSSFKACIFSGSTSSTQPALLLSNLYWSILISSSHVMIQCLAVLHDNREWSSKLTLALLQPA